MKTPYYDSEIIEVTVKVKVSWRAGNKEAREYAMEQVKDIFIGTKSGAPHFPLPPVHR